MPIFIDDIQLDWEVMPNANARIIEGRERDILMVLGSGECVFDDIKKFDLMMYLAGQGGIDNKFDVMACNLSFLAYNGPIKHLVSVHQERMEAFYELSKLLPEQRMPHIYSHSFMFAPGVEYMWPIANQEGTSAMFCVKLGLILGYKKIICCGAPLEGSRRFYDNPNQEFINNFSCPAIENAWRQWQKTEAFQKRVRSMSGKSAEILGVPTEGWLKNG